jgi:dTDP-4-dehydrorhamnose reductase
MSFQQGVQTVLLIGANGQVGHALKSAGADINTPFEWHATTRADLDVSNFSAVKDLVRTLKPNWIVNAAAYTAVDKAESEAQLAQRINADLPHTLAVEAQALGAAVVHYSTDYVFDGQAHNPYTEADQPNPQSAYGRSKWAGEQAVTAHCEKHLVLRTCWVYGAHGGNFLKTMLRLAQHKDSLRVVADQWGAPTSADLIARTTLGMMHVCDSSEHPPWGTYHVSASGRTNWHAYACEAIGQAKRLGLVTRLDAEGIQAIPASDYPTPASRPANSCLNTDKLATVLGYPLADWHNGVQDTIQELAASGWRHL